MQAIESTVKSERSRVEAVVETVAAIHNHGDNLEELAHDARNMVTALALYCDLLEEPGVLSPTHRHYGSELRLVVEASRRLVEKLSNLRHGERRDAQRQADLLLEDHLFREPERNLRSGDDPARSVEVRDGLARPRWPLAVLGPEVLQDGLIADLREELLANSSLLDAIAGPSIKVTVDAVGGARPIRMSSENLVRALVNLVKNSAECITAAGSIRLFLGDGQHGPDGLPTVVLTVEDSGSGIPEELLDRVFEAGFTTRQTMEKQGWRDSRPGAHPGAGRRRNWNQDHHGLGLSITRSIVETAGGRIHAENRTEGGARFVIELPARRP